MKFYRFCLHKKYFETGLGLTQYIKYLIAFFGIYSIGEGISMNWLLAAGMFYLIFCYILGHIYLKYGLYEADIEVSNRFNLFVKQVRKKIKA